MQHLPFSQACENNQAPIFDVLQQAFAKQHHVLEIGSGTGQHSVYLAPRLPHLIWQTSDVADNHASINAWHTAYPAANLRAPLELDLHSSGWPANHSTPAIDGVFTSNTTHIISWPLVQRMFAMVAANLPAQGVFAIYGPFNYQGKFTSDSNRAFDTMLRQRDPASGLRHFEDLVALASEHQLQLEHDYAMPANNRLLVLRKQAG